MVLKRIFMLSAVTAFVAVSCIKEPPAETVEMSAGVTEPVPQSDVAAGTVYERYQADFSELFDTHITLIAYAETEDEFNRYLEAVYDETERLNRLFDIYNSYEGVNNLKTVNDNAGIAPVEVDAEIIELLMKGKAAYESTGGMLNIAMGPVLRLWHDARTLAKADPAAARVPELSVLKAAAQNTDMSDVIIDESARTVFLKNEGMALDVGAIAKGYSTMLAVRRAQALGLMSGILNAGGNVISVGKPMDGRDRWGIGIQDPALASDGTSNIIDTVFTNDLAVVSSGNYQRFYIVDGKNYNHIIDPVSLMPAERFAGVTVTHPDSFVADMLSTVLFILPVDEGEALLEQWNAQALWINHDGSTYATDGYRAISKTYSNYSAVD